MQAKHSKLYISNKRGLLMKIIRFIMHFPLPYPVESYAHAVFKASIATLLYLY